MQADRTPSHQFVLDLGVPQAEAVEVVQQVLVDDGELARQHASDVDVGRVGLKALVVAQDLRRRGGGHRREKERVAHAVLGDLGAEAIPVPPEVADQGGGAFYVH